MFLPLNIYMVVASQLLGVAADQVPTYDFGQNCHSIATLNNSIERCANDEEDAHGKLRTLWADFSAADKERCEAVTRAAWPSYVELLACLQIAQATNGVGTRLSDDTAMARILPALIWPIAALTWSTCAGTWPAIRSRWACPLPL